MKLASYGIIGLMILLPILAVESLQINSLEAQQIQRRYIDICVEQAVEDAATAMMGSQQTPSSGGNISSAAPQVAIDTFFNSLANSLNMASREGRQQLSNYVPFIAVIDTEGYYIYAATSQDGGLSYQKMLYPRVNFIHQVAGYYIALSQDDTITMMYRDKSGKINVDQDRLAGWLAADIDQSVKEFISAPDYTVKMRQLRLNQLEADLKYYANAHNAYAQKRGISYQFAFEPIANSWTGIVEKPSIVVAVQGIPTGGGQYIDSIAYSNFTIDRGGEYCGVTIDGVRYFVSKTYALDNKMAIEKIFHSPQEAAANGYYHYEID